MAEPAPVATPSPSPTPSGLPDMAIEMLRKRATIAKNDPRVYRELGKALLDRDPVEAAKHLRYALRLDPRDDAWKPLADLYEQKGYTDRLIETIEARLKYLPNDAEAMARLAPLYLSVARKADAENLLKKAAKIAPDNEQVINAQVSFYYVTIDAPRAIAALQPLLNVRPQDDFLHYRLSELQRSGGFFDKAEASVRTAIQLKPGEGKYHRQLAHILLTETTPKRAAEAETILRKAMELGDNSIDCRYWLAIALEQQNKTKDALKAYDAVGQEDLSYEHTAFRLSLLNRKVGRTLEATQLLKLHDTMTKNQKSIAYVERVLQQKPNEAGNYITLSSYLLQLSEYGRAITILRQAQHRFPKNPTVMQKLKEALIAAGRVTEANALSSPNQIGPQAPVKPSSDLVSSG